ncbi:hypothetical protein E3N88_43747 [Mikania micrantha]|uniref:Retrotransposon Copia-like N-terminal domain-containing protein n=1 Tax=Mikania micrantha TaxID=192012 RepID=A0A5N6LEJ7_9ASTR|nr:hypothetical protein E3N88_43747 [Mikania micrantha]
MSTDGIVIINNNPSSITMVTFPSSLKLTTTNYFSWKTQIEAYLQGLDLYKFIDGSHHPPSPTIKADGTSTPHPDFTTWYHQDRLLFGALVGTLSSPIASLINHAPSSFEAWQILAKTYASPSRGHIKQLQHRLKQTTKTPNQNITDYVHSIKQLVDELAILGKVMDTEDIADLILHGLDQKAYKAQRPSSKPWHNRSNNPSPGLLPTPQTTSPSSPRPYLGKCQWCFTKGHALTSCPNFKKAHPTIVLPTFPHQPQSHKSYAHMAAHTPTGLAAHNSTGSASSWLYDSGASHNITNDLNALSLHTPYDGTDDLIIGMVRLFLSLMLALFIFLFPIFLLS